MKTLLMRIVVCLSPVVIIGCVTNEPPLGEHVARLKSEQVYNPNASQENLGVVPTGTGERMEGAYQAYTGKGDNDLSGSDSQFIGGFSN
ncbi:hypothetical protein [Vibrio maerlii]|uniref:hypothetical protein n=1 Tax=Vibrio maerlii TaxID=2231648 RepID=UPI000E3DD11D|nr:hypothetical protein [Vibrio maerlii]